MAGNVNKVDYDVLATGQTVYANQAQALDEVITALVNMNSELQASWTNQTSDAFIERFESEYKIGLQNARDAVQAISDYIAAYSAKVAEDDAASAAAI